jgi:hypothetical protein
MIKYVPTPNSQKIISCILHCCKIIYTNNKGDGKVNQTSTMSRSCRERNDDQDMMLPTTLKNFKDLKDDLSISKVVVCMNKSQKNGPSQHH